MLLEDVIAEWESNNGGIIRRASLTEMENDVLSAIPTARGVNSLLKLVPKLVSEADQVALIQGLTGIFSRCNLTQFSLGENSFIHPEAYFEFGGLLEDSISVPRIDLSNFRGISFTCRLHLAKDDKRNRHRGLFELLAVEGGGLRAFVAEEVGGQFVLVVETKGQGFASRWQHVKTRIGIDVDIWCHVTVVLATPYLQPDECRVYLDGKLVAQMPLSFPKMNTAVDHNTIGKALLGYMADPTFYSVALTPEQVSFLLAAAPRQRVYPHGASFPDETIPKSSSVGPSKVKSIFKRLKKRKETEDSFTAELAEEAREVRALVVNEHADPKILFWIDPRSIFSRELNETKDRNGLFELPDINGQRVRLGKRCIIEPLVFDGSVSTVYARSKGNVRVAFDPSPLPSTEGIGGISPLIVLLSMFVPISSRDALDLVIPGEPKELTSVLLFQKILECLGSCVEFREMHRCSLIQCNGLDVLNLILQHVPSSLLSTVHTCLSFVLRLGYCDDALRPVAAAALLFDPRIWARASDVVQEKWCRRLQSYCQLFPKESIQFLPNLIQSLVLCDGLKYEESMFVASQPLRVECVPPIVVSISHILVASTVEELLNGVVAILDFAARYRESKGTCALLQMLASMLLAGIIRNEEEYSTSFGLGLFSLLNNRIGGVDFILGLGVESFEIEPKVAEKQLVDPVKVNLVKRLGRHISNAVSANQEKQENTSPVLVTPPSSPLHVHDNAETTQQGEFKEEPVEETILQSTSFGGLMSSSGDIPPGTRAALVLIIGRMMQLHDMIVIKPMIGTQPDIQEDFERRKQKQFGIMLRNLIRVPHVASFRIRSDTEKKRLGEDVTPAVLDALASVVIGCGAEHEAAEDHTLHDDDFRLAVPEGLPVLGAMLAALDFTTNETKDHAARCVLLKLSLILKASYAAREQVTLLPRWQSWLIPVILLHDNGIERNDDNSADYVLGEVSTDLLCILMEHETQRQDDGSTVAKKLNRAQQGWSSWQGLMEQMNRIVKEKERSSIEEQLEDAKVDGKHLIPLLNAKAEATAISKMNRFVRLILERVWERLVVRLQAAGLHRDAIRNFSMTVAMCEETLIDPCNILRLVPLTAGGMISSSAATSFKFQGPTGALVLFSARCAIDGRHDTKWVDVTEEESSGGFSSSWLSYRYPDRQPHRVVFYTVACSFDLPELDPAGWTLFGRVATGDDSGWVVLDRRTEVRFSARFQKISCWARQTGFYQEYRIVFDARKGKQIKNYLNEKVYAKVQIGDVGLFETDVETWHHDAGEFAHVPVDLQAALKDHNSELASFIGGALNTVNFIRTASAFQEYGSPRMMPRRDSLKDSQLNDMPKRATWRLLGHILRNIEYFNDEVVNQSVGLVQSFLLNDLSISCEANTVAVLTLLHAVHQGLCSLHVKTSRSNRVDGLLGVFVAILDNYQPHDPAIAQAVKRMLQHLQNADDMSSTIMTNWNLMEEHVNGCLERELESEVLCRHASFRVQRATSSTMARRANPVEVAAYGAGKLSPIGLPKSVRRKVLERKGKQQMVVHTKQVDARKTFDHRLHFWRKLLEMQEILENQSFNEWRLQLYKLDSFVERRHRMKLQLVHNPYGDPHLGACSGIADRKNRKEARERESRQKSSESFGAVLSRQISIADGSLVTHEEEIVVEDPGVNKRDRQSYMEQTLERCDLDRNDLSNLTLDISEEVISSSNSFENRTGDLSPSSMNDTFINQRDKLAIDEWVQRRPDPFRGEEMEPWPKPGEEVLLVAGCRMVKQEFHIQGRILVTSKGIYFDPDPPDAAALYILRSAAVDGVADDSDFNGINSENWFKDLSEKDMMMASIARTRFLQRKNKFRKRQLWEYERMDKILLRRYHMRDSAFELFLNDYGGGSYFIDLDPKFRCSIGSNESGDPIVTEENISNGKAVRDHLMQKMWPVLPNNVKQASQKPGSDNKRLMLAYTEKWQKRQISNFEYLMRLNLLAGRSLNDLTQYPVFPWVLQDYESDQLDLEDPSVYRDLGKPMGALTFDRLEEGRERYRTFEDPHIPKFHWGSHYSTKAGCVLYYLVRMEPFTSMHIQMQDGHFDVPDRLFNSVPSAWRMCTTALSEVKELIPEFYCQPAFLRNHNRFNLGTGQDGVSVGDVELPKWANGSADVFVEKMRQALESDHVSHNLHLWIDLIFGTKARLPDAATADNVFYYLTYPGAVDMDAITDPSMLRATELQIAHFGQCPAQILTRPHPPRGPAPTTFIPIGRHLRDHPGAYLDEVTGVCSLEDTSPAAVRLLEGKILTLLQDGSMFTYVWGRREDLSRRDSTDTLEDEFVMEKSVLVLQPEPNPVYTLPIKSFRRSLNAVAWGHDGHVMATNGLGIGTLEVYFIDTSTGHMRTWSATLFAHVLDVTALAIHESVLVSGSIDGSLRTWLLFDGDSTQQRKWGVSCAPELSLAGHDSAVTVVDVNYQSGIVVSASVSRCLVHSLSNGTLIGSLSSTLVSLIKISDHFGIISIFSNSSSKLSLHSSSFLHECICEVESEDETIRDMVFSLQGATCVMQWEQVLLTVGDAGLLKILSLNKLHVLAVFKVFATESPVYPLRCIALHSSEQAVVIGAVSGQIQLVALPNIVTQGPNATIPVIGSMDVNTKLLNAKNAVMSKVESSKVVATAKGVVTEVSSVASRLAKGLGIFK